jgi:hypothetical protein
MFHERHIHKIVWGPTHLDYCDVTVMPHYDFFFSGHDVKSFLQDAARNLIAFIALPSLSGCTRRIICREEDRALHYDFAY